MDLGNIVYIVAVLAYFIYQATRGKKDKEKTDSTGTPETQAEKPVTFEDLMKEIRGAQKTNEPETVREVEATKPKENYRSSQPRKEEVNPYSYKQPETAYKAPQKEEFDSEIRYYEGAFENTKSDLLKTSKGIPEIPTLVDRKSEGVKGNVNKYAQILKNQSTLKDSIVLKEILDRKHF